MERERGREGERERERGVGHKEPRTPAIQYMALAP